VRAIKATHSSGSPDLCWAQNVMSAASFRAATRSIGYCCRLLTRASSAARKLPYRRSEAPEEHVERLRSAGIDVAAAEQSGRLELRNWAETYLQDGHFDEDRMLALA
jgi:hypothetical protein